MAPIPLSGLALTSKLRNLWPSRLLQPKSTKATNQEPAICAFLASKADEDSHSSHVTKLLDDFNMTGPNGTHCCMVFKPMGPGTASMVDELPCNKPQMYGKVSRYPKQMAKSILKQTLSALAFLHGNNVTHGDLQPGNILFSLSHLDTTGEKDLRQAPEMPSTPLQRTDGRTDPWAPEHLAIAQLLHQYVDIGHNMTVKLSDFGSGMLNSISWLIEQGADALQHSGHTISPPSTVTPVSLRAPELIFKHSFASAIDTWAFGCLLYEFITGVRLFSVDLIGDDKLEDADDDHILDLIDVLGPLPEHLMSQWDRRDERIRPNGERLQPEEVTSGTQTSEDGSVTDSGSDSDMMGAEEAEDLDNIADAGPFIADPLEVHFEKNKPDDIDEEESQAVTALIRDILQYDALSRPTAKELLQHGWFRT